MFKNTIDNKRYYTLNCYLRKRFNSKVFKVPLDAHFECPNKRSGGCIYCKNSSTSNIIDSNNSLIDQFNYGKELLLKKWPNSKYIVYFQAGTNTNASIETLSNVFNQMINLPNVVGLSIATRPDSISKKCFDLLEELNKKTFLTVELGLQSSNNNTLKLINRGHTKEDFTICVRELRKRNIFTVAHIINGLPNETKVDMLNTIKYLNKIKIDGIKIHMLYVSKGTAIEKMYNDGIFNLLSKEEYIDIVCDQLGYLNENIVIERITGDPIKEDLIEPKWLLKKFCVLNDIDKEMARRKSFQGDKVKTK